MVISVARSYLIDIPSFSLLWLFKFIVVHGQMWPYITIQLQELKAMKSVESGCKLYWIFNCS